MNYRVSGLNVLILATLMSACRSGPDIAETMIPMPTQPQFVTATIDTPIAIATITPAPTATDTGTPITFRFATALSQAINIGSDTRIDVEAMFGERRPREYQDTEGRTNSIAWYEWDAEAFKPGASGVYTFAVRYLLEDDPAVVHEVSFGVGGDLTVADMVAAFGDPEFAYTHYGWDAVHYVFAYLDRGIEMRICWPTGIGCDGPLYEANIFYVTLFEPMSAADYARERMWTEPGFTGSRSWDYLWQWHGPESE